MSSRRVVAESISWSEDWPLRSGRIVSPPLSSCRRPPHGGRRQGQLVHRRHLAPQPRNRRGPRGGARFRRRFEQDRDPVGLGAELVLQRSLTRWD